MDCFWGFSRFSDNYFHYGWTCYHGLPDVRFQNILQILV